MQPNALSRPKNQNHLHQTVSVSSGVRFDDYQKAVIECTDKCVVVRAFAGAGKTEMAKGYAAARPRQRILFIVFGKQNQLDAAARFGPNVECRTGHSLAYVAIGHRYKNQLANVWTVREFAAEMQVNDTRAAGAVMAILSNFFTSVDPEIELGHAIEASEKWALNDDEIEALVHLAKQAWSKMTVVGGGVRIPPDGYLKLWALSKPDLGYPIIILDEGQDTNPVLAKIIEEQHRATMLIVGDPHQNIYLFRGAANSMEAFEAKGATRLSMPRTWRFGPKIAHVANELLDFFKHEKTRIIGAGPGAPRREGTTRAVLSRTNAGLFDAAAAVMGRRVHWLGGIQKYRVDLLSDAWLLRTGKVKDIRDPALVSFRSWNDYMEDAARSHNVEAHMLKRVVESYGRDVPALVASIKANALPTTEGADLVLSTSHGAKGLQFDNVVVSPDFHCLQKSFDEMRATPGGKLGAANSQLVNLLYVAITRARFSVQLNGETSLFLNDISTHRAILQRSAAQSTQTTGVARQ